MEAKSPGSTVVRKAHESKQVSTTEPSAVGHESASVVEPSGATVDRHPGTRAAM